MVGHGTATGSAKKENISDITNQPRRITRFVFLIAIRRFDDAANCVRFVKQSCQTIAGELRHTLQPPIPEFFRSHFVNG